MAAWTFEPGHTIQEEFYAAAFRKKLYQSVDELQADLDDWLREYNLTRTQSGKYCYGETPMQTFLDSAHQAREKMLDSFSTPEPGPERSPAKRSAGGGAVADAAACSDQPCQIKCELLQLSCRNPHRL